ncbi:MAG: oxidoreductase domain protein [Planctomycetota bacterium]|nr:oxidoreductase domain protein [Planctomycetota bacterium]
MIRGSLSRRGFLRVTTARLAVAGLPLWYARESAAEALALPGSRRAKEKVVMGAIGTGSRGSIVLEELARRDVQVVAVCDVDARHRADARRVLRMRGQRNVAEFTDFRELLDRKDLTAVMIATPDHWHALIAIEAMKRGKDVYCEKPLGLTISESRAMVEAARKYRRVLQTGSHQRSDGRFRLACELVRNGRLGKIKTVETRIGENPSGGPFPTAKVPEWLDWNLWMGPTPEVDYTKERCHYDFRWWYEYSGGKVTDWGAHHNDIAQWALGMDESGPVLVRSESNMATPAAANCYNCPPHFKITYVYAGNASRVCDATEVVCTDGGDNGIKFLGEDGSWIFVDRGDITASDKKILDTPLPNDAARLRKSDDHFRNFLECLDSRDKPICDVAIGHRSATMCHLGNISMRMGNKPLRWSPEKERFVDDVLADEMLSRPMRAPWKIEV